MTTRRAPLSGSLPNFQHLLAFRGVGTLGSVSATARAIHRSQPAVTQAIAALERHFCESLFTRTSTGMSLSAAGSICLARAERALEHVEQAVAEIGRGRLRDAAGSAATAPGNLSGTQLASLAAVVEARGFAAAARLTGLSRPSLHRTCRALERKLGVPLFEETSFGVEPTRDAERLARRVKLAAAELAQAHAEIAVLRGRRAGRLVIGAMPLARSALVPEVILEFSPLYPELTISILDGPYQTMLLALRQGEADLLIGALREPVPTEDVVQEHLFDDPLAIVMRPGHPLARGPFPIAEDLARFPWIAPRPESPLRLQFDLLFKSAAPPTLNIVECNSLSAARALLIASDRLMLLSAHQISRDLAAGTLAVLPHPSGRAVRRIGITLRKGWHPTATQQVFLDMLRAAAARAPAD
jgi:LysR family transcriptional regulator, regulator for genes of the gallate degradation pathway